MLFNFKYSFHIYKGLDLYFIIQLIVYNEKYGYYLPN